MATNLASSFGCQQVAPSWGPPLLAPGVSAPLPPAPPLHGDSYAEDCVFRHAFTLEVCRNSPKLLDQPFVFCHFVMLLPFCYASCRSVMLIALQHVC